MSEYTTPLDAQSMPRERRIEAERIAREIEEGGSGAAGDWHHGKGAAAARDAWRGAGEGKGEGFKGQVFKGEGFKGKGDGKGEGKSEGKYDGKGDKGDKGKGKNPKGKVQGGKGLKGGAEIPQRRPPPPAGAPPETTMHPGRLNW